MGGETFPRGYRKGGGKRRENIGTCLREDICPCFCIDNGARGCFKALQLNFFLNFLFGVASSPVLAFERGEQIK